MNNSVLNLDANFTVVRKAVKNLTIKIKTDGEVVVVAPTFTSDQVIQTYLQTKKSWINKHLEIIGEKCKNKEQLFKYNIVYLGQYYPIIRISDNLKQLNQPRISLINNKFLIYEIDDSNGDKQLEAVRQEAIKKWYIKQAKAVLPEIVDNYLKITGLQIKNLSIKKMSSRWGSCNSKKQYINLNVDLIMQDIRAIEYVVLHEIIHLIHPNHSHHFYDDVAKYMPDWQSRKKLLIQY
jgi:predicted metal-dependent hydrolase